MKIEEWKNTIIKKIENIKYILNKEIIILKKMFSTYNKKYLN